MRHSKDEMDRSALGFESIYDFEVDEGRSWREHGFCLVRNAIDTELLESSCQDTIAFLRAEFGLTVDSSITDLGDCLAFVHQQMEPPEFISMLSRVLPSDNETTEVLQRVVLNAAGRVLEDEYRNLKTLNCGLFFNHPSSEETTYDWHQESTYYDADLQVVTAWLPISRKVVLEDGPMYILPGSHTATLPYEAQRHEGGFVSNVPSGLEPSGHVVVCDLELGDVVLFHPNLVHKTGPNSSGRARTTLVQRILAN